MLYRLAFLSAVAVLGSACVAHASNTLERSGQSEVLTLADTDVGLLMGPCAPYFGKARIVEARFQLDGLKDRYAPSEFNLVFERGNRMLLAKQPQGEIIVNRQDGVAEINLSYEGKPLPISGRYRFKMISTS
jgi:hypothetical protein